MAQNYSQVNFGQEEKSLELGLIDGIGSANEILKKQYGEDVIIKKFEKSKSWLARKLSSETQLENIINLVEENISGKNMVSKKIK